jgi:hypothetical protein
LKQGNPLSFIDYFVLLLCSGKKQQKDFIHTEMEKAGIHKNTRFSLSKLYFLFAGLQVDRQRFLIYQVVIFLSIFFLQKYSLFFYVAKDL